MKKLVPLLFVLLSLQAISQNRFRPGIRLGLATTQVQGDTYTGFHKAGINGGLYLNAKLNEKWKAQFEMLFIQKGSKKIANPEAGDYIFYLMQLDYIEVPVLFQYKIRKFTFEIGPGFGYLIRAREFDYFGQIKNNVRFESFELSGQAGVSFTIVKNLEMNWRYSNSLLPIRKFTNPNVSATYNPGQRNNVLSFTLMYTFGKSDAQ
jgi:hypothetical protein